MFASSNKLLRNCAFCLALGTAGQPALAKQLLSIVHIALKSNELVQGFTVGASNTWVVAVCHIPDGWSINVGNQISWDTKVVGGADGGVARFGQAQLKSLEDLFLIADPQRGDPTKFEGYIQIGYNVDNGNGRAVQLSSSNIALTPADRCPVPP